MACGFGASARVEVSCGVDASEPDAGAYACAVRKLLERCGAVTRGCKSLSKNPGYAMPSVYVLRKGEPVVYRENTCGLIMPVGQRGCLPVMYPFMTLDDGAEITHSEMSASGEVRVYVEKSDERDCFHHATCYLPSRRWVDEFGFSPEELARYDEVVASTAHLILAFAQDGGFEHAQNL